MGNEIMGNKSNVEHLIDGNVFKSFFEYSLDLFCIASTDGYFLTLNPKWKEVLGYSLKELQSKPFVDFVHPDDRQLTIDETNKLKSGNVTVSFINRYRHKSGNYKWLEWSAILNPVENLILASARDVSDRIALSQMIEEHDHKLNLMIRYSPAPISLLDKELNYLFVSQKWLEDNKIAESDVIGKNIKEVFPVLSKNREWGGIFISSLKGNVEKGSNYKFELRDGKIIWLNWEIRPWKKISGETGGLFIFTENITERVENLEKLKESERFLKETQKIAKIGSWEYDPHTRDVIWNDEMYEMLGVDREKHSGKIDLLFELAHPDDRERFINTVKKSSVVKTTVPIEYRSITPAGEIKHLYAKGGSILDENGEVIKFYGTYQDITEQKLAEQAILNSEKKFRSMLASAPDAIFIINSEGKIDITNDRAEKLFGYSKEEMKCQPIDVFLRDDLTDEKTCLRKYFNFDTSVESNGIIELVGVNNDGEKFPVEVSISPIDTDQGLLFNMAIRDISERKEAEFILHKKTEELKIKNKELEQFAFVASHDLQEPLRTISSFVELLGNEYEGELDDTADTYIKFVLEASERMRVLIKNLLDYSRIGRSQELEKIDCNVVVKNLLEDLSVQIIQSDAKLSIDKLPIILGNEVEIKQLFQNLISNAIKFRRDDVPPEIRISAVKEEQYWKFAVADNGIGLNKKHKEKIFVIFQRLHNRKVYEGTGIGLAHCKKIVELHGGKIWVISELYKGSTFYFTIKA